MKTGQPVLEVSADLWLKTHHIHLKLNPGFNTRFLWPAVKEIRINPFHYILSLGPSQHKSSRYMCHVCEYLNDGDIVLHFLYSVTCILFQR